MLITVLEPDGTKDLELGGTEIVELYGTDILELTADMIEAAFGLSQ